MKVAFLLLALCCSVGYTAGDQTFKDVGDRNKFAFEGIVCYFNSIQNGPPEQKPELYKYFVENFLRSVERLATDAGVSPSELFQNMADLSVYNQLQQIAKIEDYSNTEEVEETLNHLLPIIQNIIDGIQGAVVPQVLASITGLVTLLQNGQGELYGLILKGITCRFEAARNGPEEEKPVFYKYIGDNTIRIVDILSSDLGLPVSIIFLSPTAKDVYNKLKTFSETGDYSNLKEFERTMEGINSLIDTTPGGLTGFLVNAALAAVGGAVTDVAKAGVGLVTGLLGGGSSFGSSGLGGLKGGLLG